MANDTAVAERPPLPAKPRKDFPLTPHRSGKWTKKIRGKFYYFGRWEDPDGAEAEYDRVKHDLRAGRSPLANANPATLTIRDLFNVVLERRLERVDMGTYAPRSYTDLKGALADFGKEIGPGRIVATLTPGDFANYRSNLDKRGWGAAMKNRTLTNIKTAFRFGMNNGLIEKAVPFGDAFNKESAAVRRREVRAKADRHGKKLFAPAEVRAIVDKAEAPVKAMILLALNCGFNAADVANLPRSAVDFDNAFLDFPRVKNEMPRQCVLWPETVAALKEALKVRPKPRHEVDAGMFFLTKYGNRWVHVKVHKTEGAIVKTSRTDAISQEFTHLLKTVKVKRKPIRRRGVNFSALRHTFRTAADEVADRNAILLMMGHAFKDMDSFYVRDLARLRLAKVAEHVRKKLLDPK